MNLRDARIGYDGYSPDLRGPGDRRRFCAYGAHRRIPYERADPRRDYDLVLVTHNGDIPGWTERKRRDEDSLRFVFELVDSYFTQTNLARRLLKGSARFALGTDSRLSPDFLRTLVRACEAADAVICSTDEQRETILKYNRNTFISFDYFGDEIGPRKERYERSGKFRVVWEGQSTTLRNIQSIRGVLDDLRDRITLHVVTDPMIHRYFGRFGPHPSADALRGIECEIVFYPWRRESFSNHIIAADLAIIPIDTSNAFARGKPENKLIMLWQLGMPVLASATPAYARAMRAAGVDMLCATPGEWRAQFERMIAAPPSELERTGMGCRTFVDSAYSKEEFLKRFDAAFAAAGFTT